MTDPTPKQMREQLVKHRGIFAGYARNHRAKVSPLRQRLSVTNPNSANAPKLEQQITDTIAKAEANEQLAAEVETLLGLGSSKAPDYLASTETKS